MKKSAKIIVSSLVLLISSLVYGQVTQGEFGIYQNGKIVGEIYVPQKQIANSYMEYYAIATDYSYLKPSARDSKPYRDYFADKETFRKAMTKKFLNGRFIESHCREEEL